MPSPIENYIPQVAAGKYRQQTFAVWSVLFLAALVWVLLIISAPLARANGFSEFANSVYTFFSYLCHQLPARSFHFGEHAFAVCSRCFGFYAGLFLGFGFYPLFRSLNETNPLPRIWLFLAMIPMGADWSLMFFGVWENTHLSRAVTGAILGAACAVFIVPALLEIIFLRRRKARKN